MNLRFATRSQNGANKGIAISNTSGYKGVSFNQGKWEARIRVEQRRIHLGRYPSALEAALTYDAAARLFNGDFAGVNFPDVPTPEPQRLHLERLLAKRPGVRAHLERVGRLYEF
ncbi:MAG: AP2/ERF family transcription factor [Anaerolineae bacterium]|nr:AP2/ERF family transcription factor [Anaerolineae bacterium]